MNLELPGLVELPGLEGLDLVDGLELLGLVLVEGLELVKLLGLALRGVELWLLVLERLMFELFALLFMVVVLPWLHHAH